MNNMKLKNTIGIISVCAIIIASITIAVILSNINITIAGILENTALIASSVSISLVFIIATIVVMRKQHFIEN